MKLRKLFDQCANDYDRDRPKLVPDFASLYGTALRVMPFAREEAIRVLDLGAGTGLFGAMIALAFPEASLHLTDISAAMLAKAQERFAGNPKVRCLVQEHSQLADIGKYDLVVSALSIHHLPDADKQNLFGKIHRALKPGGAFVNIDQVRAPSAAAEVAYERFWREEARAAGVSETALNQAMERMREDKNALLTEQLLWLERAGFVEVDCWYKRFRFVVFGGRKTASEPLDPCKPAKIPPGAS
ncbi:MAG: class I SAM-dependent methyltransferase [Desulfurivibrionaceae bacterium]